MEKQGFFKNHADTVAIIGVNLAGVALLVTMWLSHAGRMDAANSRLDTLSVRMDTIQTLMYQEMKDFHGRLCAIEERRSS